MNVVVVLKKFVLFQLNINKFNFYVSWLEIISCKVFIQYINNCNLLRQDLYFFEKKNFVRWVIIVGKKEFILVRKNYFFRIEYEGSEMIWKLKFVKL